MQFENQTQKKFFSKHITEFLVSGHQKIVKPKKPSEEEIRKTHLSKKELKKRKQFQELGNSFFKKAGSTQEKEAFEDARITQAYFSTYMLIDTSGSCLSFMGVGLSALVFELEFKERFEDIAKPILWVIFISCLFNAALTFFRYKSHLVYKQKRQQYSEEADLVNTGKIFPMICEMIIVLLHPNPFLHGQKFDFINSWAGDIREEKVYYKWNEIMALLGIIKITFVIRTLLMQTKWYSNRVNRVGDMYGIKPSLVFICKCIMKKNPYSFVCSLYITTVIFFGFSLKIAEAPLYRNVNTGFNSYANCFWTIIVTMTTIGYGDFYPYTTLGRFLIFIVCILGTFVTSLMVLSLTTTLETTTFENRAICVLDKLIARQNKFELAAKSLSQLVIFTKFGKKKQQPGSEQLRKKLQDTFKNFMKIQSDYKEIKDENLIEEMHREFELIRKEMLHMKRQHYKLLKKKIQIMQAYEMDENIINKYNNENVLDFDQELKDEFDEEELNSQKQVENDEDEDSFDTQATSKDAKNAFIIKQRSEVFKEGFLGIVQDQIQNIQDQENDEDELQQITQQSEQ